MCALRSSLSRQVPLLARLCTLACAEALPVHKGRAVWDGQLVPFEAYECVDVHVIDGLTARSIERRIGSPPRVVGTEDVLAEHLAALLASDKGLRGDIQAFKKAKQYMYRPDPASWDQVYAL